MLVKLLEIRDRATFMPMFAALCEPSNEGQAHLLRRAGYGLGTNLVIFGYLEGKKAPCTYDPYDWGDRTKRVAHQYITEHWNDLKDGDVIDVEFILGESTEKKISERNESYV